MRGTAVWGDDTAVSHVIGVVLLVGIAVVLVTTVGAFVLSSTDEARTEQPQFEIDCNIDAGVIRHAGGDPVDGENLDLQDPDHDIDDGRTFTAGDELIRSSAGLAVTFDTQIAWADPTGGSFLVAECGP